MLRFGKVTITPGFWFLLAGTILSGAGEVLPLVTLALLLHELGHLAALSLAGTSVEAICFTAFGAEIQADTRYLPYWKDVLCTLSGPAVNILAALLLSRSAGDYLLAGANLLQGAFNLLPLTGLDGARALRLVLSWVLGPVRADWISRFIELVCAALFCVLSLWLISRYRTGGFLIFAVVGVFLSIWREMLAKSTFFV